VSGRSVSEEKSEGSDRDPFVWFVCKMLLTFFTVITVDLVAVSLHCSRGSRQLVRRLARCFIMKASTEASPIGVMWPLMLGWYRRRGGAARSTASKASPKPAIRVCVTS
jgi:hypothetical protein